MARRNYSEETKAAAMAALLTGQSISEVAKEYEIPVGTVKGWRSKAGSDQPVPTQKKAKVGDLLVEYLETSLATLRVQSQKFGDADWIEKQPASEMAVLHGVMADKTIRILEALGNSER
jgi:transposase-like protein